MFAREAVFRASVLKNSLSTSSCSNAYDIMSNFASVFTNVRCADAANHVEPISIAFGRIESDGLPSGDVQYSADMNRVVPTTVSVSVRMVAKGSAVPRCMCIQCAFDVALNICFAWLRYPCVAKGFARVCSGYPQTINMIERKRFETYSVSAKRYLRKRMRHALLQR